MTTILRCAIGTATLFALALPASAQSPGHRRVVVAAQSVTAPPLTVTKRSWLDVGNVVPVGTSNVYMAENTTLHEPVYASYLPDRFGRSTLPRQFTLPFQDNPRGPESGGIFFDN